MTNDPTAPSARAREVLDDLYRAAIAAAMPGDALRAALQRGPLHRDPPSDGRIWLIALGKAALPMAEAALAELAARGLAPAGGLIVAPSAAADPHPRVPVVVGDHPEPGAGSFAAAERLAELCARVAPGDEAWVLLSGGTTSLVGAPDAGLPAADLTRLYALLLRSGLDIAAMNAVRKRFTRWGGGRLARALGAAARIRTYVVSDVIGDDLAAIGSGPCVPDPTTAGEILARLADAGLLEGLPSSLRRALDAAARGEAAETPKPGDSIFANVDIEIVASNRMALEAVARRAAGLGLASRVIPTPMAGEASEMGAHVARALLNHDAGPDAQQGSPHCLIWGGETTVTLRGEAGLGGRSQELALAAARALEGAPEGRAVLAAGTDGRDGPTDAAGAIVDGQTWAAIRAAGLDPADHLARHDSYPALKAVGALLTPGMTGTNVMDVVIALHL